MKWLRQSSSGPLWKEEFSVRAGDERYVTRRQLTKFLVVTSFGMFVGNLWILLRSVFYRAPSYPQQTVARLGEIPVGGVKLFTYPSKEDRCILVRTSEDEHVGYSQKCTHLSCAVIPKPDAGVFHCPCHEGVFDLRTGRVIAGPPPRPLPRILLEVRGGDIYATGIETRSV